MPKVAFLVILVSLLLGSLRAAAGITYDFAYSGRLADSSGKPYDGPVALSVSFFRDASGGPALLTLTDGLNALTLQDGIFQVKLTLSASDYSLVFADVSQPVYVQITDLTHSASTPYPRQQISMIPYAAKVPVDQKTIGFNAQGQLAVLPGSRPAAGQFLTADSSGGFVWATPAGGGGAGTAANNLVQLDGAARLPAVDGSQLTNVSASSVGGASASSVASAAVAATSAAAVNTASTLVKRDAAGNFAAGTITANLTGNVSGAAGSVAAAGVTGLTAGSIPFAGATGLAQDNANFFWDNTAKRVGIGTASPGGVLDVETSATGNTVLAQLFEPSEANGSTSSIYFGKMTSGFGNYGYLSHTVNGNQALSTVTFGIGGNNPAITAVLGHTGIGLSPLALPLSVLDVAGGVAIGSYATTNAAPANSLIVSGSVGIGSTNPGATLDVAGSLNVAPAAGVNFGVNSANGGTLAFLGDELIVQGRNGSPGTLFQVTNSGTASTSQMTFTGRVGIGTAIPAAGLDIVSSGPQLRLTDAANAANYATFTPDSSGLELYVGYPGGEAPLRIRAGGSETLQLEPSDITTSSHVGSVIRTNAGGLRLRSDDGLAYLYLGSNFNGQTSSGHIGVGTNAPAVALQVIGDVRVGTSGTNGCVQQFAGTQLTGTCSSDARLKKDIQPLAPILDRLSLLEPSTYYWRADEFPDRHYGDGQQLGLIAQQVRQHMPELVEEGADGYLKVRFGDLPIYTLAGLRELKAATDAQARQLQADNAELRMDNAQLKADLAAVKAALCAAEPQLAFCAQ